MIAKGGSYLKKNGKLELVERTEEPKATETATAISGEQPKQTVKPKGA